MGGLYVCFTNKNIIPHDQTISNTYLLWIADPAAPVHARLASADRAQGAGSMHGILLSWHTFFHSCSNFFFGVWRKQWEEPLGFDHPKLCELRWKHVSTWRHESQILRRHPAQHETQAFLYETGHLSDLEASWVKYHMSRIPTRDNPS